MIVPVMPARYSDILARLETLEVSYGYGGLTLFAPEKLAAGQLGYSIAQDGTTLCTGEDGTWQPNWIVIGYDTGLGDPLILDIADPKLPVLTSMHGEGSWQADSIAISLEAFRDCFQQFALIAEGRSSPVECEENPVSDAEREAFRRTLWKINEEKIEPDFWDALLEY